MNTDGQHPGAPRGRRFPALALVASLAAVALVVVAVTWIAPDGDGSGSTPVVREGDGDAGGAMALPEGSERAVRGIDPVAGGASADPATPGGPGGLLLGDLPDYDAGSVTGRLVVADGGLLPNDLRVWAGVRRASPQIRSFAIGGDRLQDYREEVEDNQLGEFVDLEQPDSFVRLDERLRLRTLTTPAPDGTFTIEHVPATGAWLQIDHDTLYAHDAVALEPRRAGERELVVVLERGAHIGGVVADDAGDPLAGAEVEGATRIDAFLMFDDTLEMVRVLGGESGTDGTWALRRVPVEGNLQARFELSGFETTRVDLPGRAPGARLEVDVTMARGATIRGHVVDASGAPVPSTRVKLQTASLDMSDIDAMGRVNDMESRTDTEGAFVFRSLQPDGYRVYLAGAGWLVEKSEVFEVERGRTVEGVTLVARRGLSISGVVVDEEGAPVTTAKVTAAKPPSMMSWTANLDKQMREEVPVDEDGRFEIFGYEEGSLRLWGRAEGYLGSHVDAEAGDADVVLELGSTTTVSGIVIALEDSEPVVDYSVMLVPEGGLFDMTKLLEMEERMSNLPPPQRVRDEDGEFRVAGVPPGAYDLTVTADGYARTAVRGVDVVPGKGAQGVVVLVPSEAKVVGEVVSGRTGEPLEGASITSGATDIMSMMSQRLTGESGTVRTDAEGRFEMRGLGGEPVQLTVKHADHQDLGLGELRLDEGEVRDLGVLRLSAGATLYGHVREPDGAPVPDCTVIASNPTGSNFRRTTTDSDGAWEILGLAAGTYNVTRMDFRMDAGSDDPMSYMKDIVFETVSIEEDERKRVDLVSNAGGSSLEGRISSSEGPEAHAMVWALREDGPGTLRLGTSDDDGWYEIEGLHPGRYLLQVLPSQEVAPGSGAAPTAPVSRVVEVAGGPPTREDVRLPGGSLVGRTVDARTGDALAGIRVVLERTDEGRTRSALIDATGGRTGEAYSDETGTFRFRHLDDGTYDVLAGGANIIGMGEKGWSITRVPGVTVAESRAGFTLEIELQPAGSIIGEVEDTRGKPLGGVPIWARDDRTGRWTSLVAETTTTSSGAYEVHSLEPGPWTLAVGGTTHALTVVPGITVRRERATELDVVLQAGVEVWFDASPHRVDELTLHVLSGAGAVPLELSALESLMGGGGDPRRKRLGRLAAGSYDVTVGMPDGEVVRTTVTLSGAGGSQTVTLDGLGG